MTGESLIKNKSWYKTRQFFVAAIFSIVVVGTPVVDVFSTQGKIYHGVNVGPINVGGLTIDQARARLEQEFNKYLSSSTTFILNQTQATIPLNDIIEFDIEQTLENAQAIGNDGSIAQQATSRIKARFSNYTIQPIIEINTGNLSSFLEESFGEYGTPPQNARFSFLFENDSLIINTLPGQHGEIINTEKANASIILNAQTLQNNLIELALHTTSPKVTIPDLEKLSPEAEKLLNNNNFKITSGKLSWPITPAILAGWITVEKTEDTPYLTLDYSKVEEWLNEIAKLIESSPQNAEFELDEENKKVTKFAMSKNGMSLPRQSNFEIIRKALFEEAPAELETIILTPEIKTAPLAEKYNIIELVGSGTTDFAGSPSNRKKNIARGAEMLHGELIEPGEEFSLLSHLKPFTLENGYLLELVIKPAEGKTVPEIGGGLCQIGTTMFRTILDSGLPVTARRNHSYRVSYYEPPVGMDATIYDPWPDFKYINDTAGFLVLTTHIEGTKITFNLWGTKDGRTVSLTDPIVSNFKQPAPTKIIKTLALKPGEKKCTEHAHVGSDAEFTYTVTYPDGEVKEEEFFSRYRPWQEVCLLGVKPEEMIDVNEDLGALTVPEDATLPSTDALGSNGT